MNPAGWPTENRIGASIKHIGAICGSSIGRTKEIIVRPTVANVIDISQSDWLNPNNVLVGDFSYAYTVPSGQEDSSNQLVVSGFDASVISDIDTFDDVFFCFERYLSFNDIILDGPYKLGQYTSGSFNDIAGLGELVLVDAPLTTIPTSMTKLHLGLSLSVSTKQVLFENLYDPTFAISIQINTPGAFGFSQARFTQVYCVVKSKTYGDDLYPSTNSFEYKEYA